jgi:hypothetical protein
MKTNFAVRLAVFGTMLAMAVLVMIMPAAANQGPTVEISTTSYINLMNRIKLM